MMTLNEEADAILRDWAKSEGKSLRQLGIIDQRRERTVREKEVPFAVIFGRRRKMRDDS